jgi:hypothetical protein
VQQQATAFLATQTACPTCGRERSLKDHKTLGLRTLFGKLSLDNPVCASAAANQMGRRRSVR